MKIKQAVKAMEDLEDNLICLNSQLDIAIMNCWDGQKIKAINDISKLKIKATEIYINFDNGCGGEFEEQDIPFICTGKTYNGKVVMCPNCEYIKKMHDAILVEKKNDM